MPEQRLIKKIQRSIIKEFPEYAQVQPTVTAARIEPQMSIYRKLAMGLPKRGVTVYKMRFKKDVVAEDDVILKKLLTVTFDDEGNIIKITESK